MKTFKTVIIIIVVVLILIIIFLVFNYIMKGILRKNVRLTPIKKTNMAFGSYVLDENNQRQYKTIKIDNNRFNGQFTAGGFFEQETEFNVMLLDNFKQIKFSIDENSKNISHTIKIPKNQSTDYQFYKHTISIDDIQDGMNDMILIFTQKYSGDDLDFYMNKVSAHKSTYITRFTIENKNNNGINIIADKTYKVMKGNPLDDIQIYDKEFDEFSPKSPPDYTPINRIENLKSEEKIKIPVTINTKSTLEGSPFYNAYLYDERLGKTETIAVFTLINNELKPVNYTGEKPELVHFYEKKMEEAIMINPQIEVPERDYNNLNIIAICYPFTFQEDVFNTYKVTKWSSGIISHEVFLKTKK